LIKKHDLDMFFVTGNFFLKQTEKWNQTEISIVKYSINQRRHWFPDSLTFSFIFFRTWSWSSSNFGELVFGGFSSKVLPRVWSYSSRSLQTRAKYITTLKHKFSFQAVIHYNVVNQLYNYITKHKWFSLSHVHIITDFSWPGGFPSHVNAQFPGSIHEGG
jgi:hypothetical protein